MKLVLTGLCAAAAGLGGLAVAHADLRSFTQTYEYSTQPEGTTSLQLWHTQSRATRGTSAEGAPHFYEGLLEIEHGLTEHLDLAFNTMIGQQGGGMPGPAGEALTLVRAELEARYRFAERGELPIDPQVMVEVAKYFGDRLYEGELRLIGARDFDEITIAANAGVQVIGGKDADGRRTQILWSAGATYQVVPRLRLGVETWGYAEDGDAYADVGATLCFIASPRFWVAATYGVGVAEPDETPVSSPTHGAPSVRAIVGFEL